MSEPLVKTSRREASESVQAINFASEPDIRLAQIGIAIAAALIYVGDCIRDASSNK